LARSRKKPARYGWDIGAKAEAGGATWADGKMASKSFQAACATGSASPWVSEEKSSVTSSRRVMFSERSR
jgi:hypothetical protein